MKETYLQSVRSLLDCPASERERLMARLEGAVSAYLEDVPDAAEGDLIANFGAPEDCAAQLLEECAPAAVAAERQRQKRRARIALAVLAAVLVVAVCLVIHMWSNGGLVVIETTHYTDGIPEWFPTDGEGSITYHYDE